MALWLQDKDLSFPLPFFSLSQYHKNSLQPLLGLNICLSITDWGGIMSVLVADPDNTLIPLMARSSRAQAGWATHETAVFEKYSIFPANGTVEDHSNIANPSPSPPAFCGVFLLAGIAEMQAQLDPICYRAALHRLSSYALYKRAVY